MYYTRWAYALSLAIIICTLYYIRDYGAPKRRYAIWYCIIVYGTYFIFAGASVYWQYNNGGTYTTARIVRLAMDMAVCAVNATALLLLSKKWHDKERFYCVISGVTILCVSLQFFVFSLAGVRELNTEGKSLTETEYFYRNENFRTDGNFEYRTNFNVINSGIWPSSNFGLICNRPSIETFHSVQNARIQKWKGILSDTIHPKRVFKPRKFIKSFETLMSVKDLAILSEDPIDSTILGKPMVRKGLFSIFESDHFLPMGFTYDRYIISDTIDSISQLNREIDIPKILLSALAINKADEIELSPFLEESCIDENIDFDSLVTARRTFVCDRFEGHTRGFDAHIELDSTKVVFFSVVSDNGFKAYIDDRPAKIFDTNLGFSSVIVPAGDHKISFRYFTPGLKLGMLLTLFGCAMTISMFFHRL